MIYNKITLAFPEREEKLFQKKNFSDSILQVRYALIILALLYGAFGFLDIIMFPEFAKIFHIIRYFFVIPFILIVFALSFTTVFQKIWQELLFMSYILGGVGIGIMILFVPTNYSYISGMMLVFAAGYFIVKLRFIFATSAGWTILLAYNIGVFLFLQVPEIFIITTNFFFISANIIGMVASYNIEFYARRNFYLNHELDQEKQLVENINKNLEKIVEERTNELIIAKELAESNNSNITAILEGTQDNIWAFDRNYNILYINHVFQKEFHQTFGVLLIPGVNLIDSLPEVIRPIWKSRYDRVLNNEQFTIEDAIDAGDEMIYIQVTFNPITNRDKIIGASCFGSDISLRKRAEIDLVKAKEKAEESDRLKSSFLANMSHEIRTPMNGILGFSELLKNPELTGEKQQEYIDIIQLSGDRMLNIINNIIDISKIEAGLMQLHLSESNINEQMQHIFSFFEPEVETKGMKIILNNNLHTEETIIRTDSEKFYAILTNLIKNAVKYSNSGVIEFGYLKKRDFLEFYIKDTGVGIPKERQAAIFERFIQADLDHKMVQQGAGLGLSITKSFIEMLGGEIWVESEPGVGSTFYFTLPYQK